MSIIKKSKIKFELLARIFGIDQTSVFNVEFIYVGHGMFKWTNFTLYFIEDRN